MIAKKTSEQDFLWLEEDDLFSSLPKKKKNPNYGSKAKKFKWVVWTILKKSCSDWKSNGYTNLKNQRLIGNNSKNLKMKMML